jgi:sigma-B regulation protein RsbU (phosphoserine phosphatase)
VLNDGTAIPRETSAPDPRVAAPEDLYLDAPCGLLLTDPAGRVVEANRTIVRWIGLQRQDLIGRRFSDLLSAGARIYYETHYAPLLRMQGHVRELALDVICADGHRLPTLINANTTVDADGTISAIRIAIFDATERRDYEQELLRAKAAAETAEQHARALVTTLQSVLIPPALPPVAGLDIAAVYRPAGSGAEVGGDFYDLFQIDEDRWALVIGDVCGKGIPAATLTALARHTLRGAAVVERSPSKVLAALNLVLRNERVDRFCTVCFVLLHHLDGIWTATVSSAGHPLPVRVRSTEQPEVIGRPGALLGVFAQPALHDTPFTLEPDASYVMYTDGVTEGRYDDEFYETTRLPAALTITHTGSATLAQHIVADCVRFQNGHTRDDIALVVLRLAPTSSPARPTKVKS